MLEKMQDKITESVCCIQKKCGEKAEIAIVLGSGLGPFAQTLLKPSEICYEDIQNFPVSTVEGHAGKLVFGEMNGKKLAVMSGRFHFYEGYAMQQVVFAIRVFAKLGIKKLIVTNAAGGINTSFTPGDLMMIDDHINLLGTNPLIGPNLKDFGPRFPDMSTAYTPRLKDIALAAAKKQNIALKRGVYIAVTGPSYETPAEIRMMRILGADAVGMSTVPEVIVARHMGMEILGISCITNMAAGILNQPLSHQEVFDTAEKTKTKFIALLKEVIANM